MRTIIYAAALLAATSLAFASAPAAAQNMQLQPGDYVEVSGIDILPGGYIQYEEYLVTQWRAQQEFAKAQGWIKGYWVESNVNARDGEPDLFLGVVFASLPDAAEEARRTEAYRAHMRTTDAAQGAASRDRGAFRRVMGSMLLRQLRFPGAR